jgi:RNA recognition motif-containing protein
MSSSLPRSSTKSKKHDHSDSTLTERLFVCNIAPTTKRRALEKLFQEYGHVKELSFSPGLGYCFVEFKLIEAANACRLSTLLIDGRVLRIDLPTRKKSDAESTTSSAYSTSTKSGAGTPIHGQSGAGTPAGQSQSPSSSRRSSNHESMFPTTAGWPALPTPLPRSKTSFVDAARPSRQPNFSSTPPLSSSSITPSSQDSTATDTPPSLTPSLKSDSTTSTASEGGEQFHSMATFPVTALFYSGTETKGYEDSTLPLWSSSVATQGGPSQRTSSSSSSSSSSAHQLLSQGRDWVKYQRLPSTSVLQQQQQPLGYRPLPNALQSSSVPLTMTAQLAVPPEDETTHRQSNGMLRIFAGKLSSRVTTDVLTKYLVDFLVSEGLTEDPINHLADVFMPLDLNLKPRGFAFITFQSQVAFDAVLNYSPHIIDGKEIVIDAAAPRGIKVRTDLPGRPWEVLPPPSATSSAPPSALQSPNSDKTELQSLTEIVSCALANQTNIDTLTQALIGAMRESFGATLPQAVGATLLQVPQTVMPQMINPFHMLNSMHTIPFPPFPHFMPAPIMPFPRPPTYLPMQDYTLRSDAPSFPAAPSSSFSSSSSFLPQSTGPLPEPFPTFDKSSPLSSIFASLRNGEGLDKVLEPAVADLSNLLLGGIAKK